MALMEANWTPSTRELKQFAAIWFPALFTVVAGAVLLRTGSPRIALIVWCIALAIGFVGYFVPRAMRPIFIGLMCVTYPIGGVVSHAVLLFVFFGVMTPIGILMRLVGRDPLDRAFDRSAKTYWFPHRQETTPGRYLRQF